MSNIIFQGCLYDGQNPLSSVSVKQDVFGILAWLIVRVSIPRKNMKISSEQRLQNKLNDMIVLPPFEFLNAEMKSIFVSLYNDKLKWIKLTFDELMIKIPDFVSMYDEHGALIDGYAENYKCVFEEKTFPMIHFSANALVELVFPGQNDLQNEMKRCLRFPVLTLPLNEMLKYLPNPREFMVDHKDNIAAWHAQHRFLEDPLRKNMIRISGKQVEVLTNSLAM